MVVEVRPWCLAIPSRVLCIEMTRSSRRAKSTFVAKRFRVGLPDESLQIVLRGETLEASLGGGPAPVGGGGETTQFGCPP
jgi:hypothetical protein